MEEIEELDLEQGRKEKDLKGAKDSLMSSMNKRFEAVRESGALDAHKCTIFKVPANIRKSKPHLFEPSVVSIGPYHRGKEHLRTMEEKKWPLLLGFLGRATNDGRFETCITKMRELEGQARMCYSETIKMDSDSFVEMMLLDGSFILQYILAASDRSIIPALCRGAGWSAIVTLYDLILIENQIPFFIVERMFFYLRGFDMTQDHMRPVCHLFLRELVPTINPPPPKEIYHILHLCHSLIVPIVPVETTINGDKTPNRSIHSKITAKRSYFFPSSKKQIKRPKSNHRRSIGSLPCATELQEAGVKIKKKKPPCHFTDITFQSGVLQIPFLHINDPTLVIMMNLVALEQGSFFSEQGPLEVPKLISTYNLFMDAIVNTANDVTILQRLDIIENMLSGEEEVANYFNQSGYYVEIDEDHYLAELFMNINEYCQKTSHRNRAKLMRDYFSNPWSMLSLGGAIFLLLLTITQTFFSAFAYFRPPRTPH